MTVGVAKRAAMSLRVTVVVRAGVLLVWDRKAYHESEVAAVKPVR